MYMDVVNDFSELPGGNWRQCGSGGQIAMFNMSPIIHEFGNIKIDPGPEKPKGKEKHVHARVSGGVVKISIERGKPELIPSGTEGNPKQKEVAVALEQVERYYDEIKENYENFHSGKPIHKTVGKKVKGKNRQRPTG
jgi:hypothetical protein